MFSSSPLFALVWDFSFPVNLPFVAHLPWEKSNGHHRSGYLSFLALPPGFLSTLGWDRSSLVNLPLPISCLPCSRMNNCCCQIWIRRPRGWWTVTSRFASEDFALGLLNSSLFYSFEGWGNGPTCEGWDYPLAFNIWALPWALVGWSDLQQIAFSDFWALQQIASPCMEWPNIFWAYCGWLYPGLFLWLYHYPFPLGSRQIVLMGSFLSAMAR